MSPFSHLIHALRMRHNIRQVDLAPRLGYDQSFLSALEVGIKGPPSMEFIDRFIEAVPVSPDEAAELVTALEASQRKVVIDADSPQEIFWLLHALRSNISNLSPAKVRLIRELISLPEQSDANWEEPARRLKRRQSQSAARQRKDGAAPLIYSSELNSVDHAEEPRVAAERKETTMP